MSGSGFIREISVEMRGEGFMKFESESVCSAFADEPE
jgi:hypothetical protein